MFGIFRKKKETPPKTETKPVPEKERRIYIIDFDRTITILHTGGLAYGNELSPDYVLKNVKKGFADFIRMATDRGHKVYIASYSDDSNAGKIEEKAFSGHELIRHYMQQVLGPDQKIFTLPEKNQSGVIINPGNIIAHNTQDYKQYHLYKISELEGLDPENPEDMKRIYLIEDDEEVVRSFMEKGCTIIVPFSASRSADTAATKTLFTSYMPESFRA